MDKVEKAVIDLGGEWPAKGLTGHNCVLNDYMGTSNWTVSRGFDSEYICTYPEFMEARKRLENKPSWDDAPEEARSLTQDDIGNWTFWRGLPVETEHGGWASDDAAWHCGKGHVFGDWRQSLEPRPSSHPMNHEHQDHKEGECVKWDGEGYPPVGCKCDISHPGSDGWHRGRVIAYYKTSWSDSGEAIVMQLKTLFPEYDDGVAVLNIDSELKFRPIQSHRDKVIEAALSIDDVRHAAHGADLVVKALAKHDLLKLPGEEE